MYFCSGSSENIVQAVYLRCQQGHILWERPRGGLRVNISPPPYLYRSDAAEPESFQLCLESNTGSHFQVFLEQSSSDDDEDRRKLLPFLSPESTTCYRIATSSATLYVESQRGDEEKSPKSKDAYQVKISYEIEESKIRTSGFNGKWYLFLYIFIRGHVILLDLVLVHLSLIKYATHNQNVKSFLNTLTGECAIVKESEMVVAISLD